jgi:hypothetical protein
MNGRTILMDCLNCDIDSKTMEGEPFEEPRSWGDLVVDCGDHFLFNVGSGGLLSLVLEVLVYHQIRNFSHPHINLAPHFN